MWYLTLSNPGHPLSPRRQHALQDPDSHAHSPRRRCEQDSKQVTSPTSCSHPFVDHSTDNERPSQSAINCNLYPDLSGICQGRRAELLSLSGASSHLDLSMPDYARPLSPNSVPSVQMADYSRPSSTAVSDVLEPPSYPQLHQTQIQNLNLVRSKQPTNAGSHTPNPTARESSLAPGTMSGNKDHNSECGDNGGYPALANTRASNVAQTLSASTRPSAAKEARDASYSGKQRLTSINSRETLTERTKACLDPANVGKAEHCNIAATSPLTKTPNDAVKSKKEGRSSNVGVNVLSENDQRLNPTTQRKTSPDDHDTASVSSKPSGDLKRRRLKDTNEAENVRTDRGAQMETCSKDSRPNASKGRGKLATPNLLRSSSGNVVRR